MWAIKAVTSTQLDIPENMGEIVMCEAVKEMTNEGQDKCGLRMLVEQLNKGYVAIESVVENADEIVTVDKVYGMIKKVVDESEGVGEFKMLVKQVQKGRITIEQAAEDYDTEVDIMEILKVVEETQEEREERGGLRMLVKQVGKGRITIEQAAEDANMSVEQFKKVLDDMQPQAL